LDSIRVYSLPTSANKAQKVILSGPGSQRFESPFPTILSLLLLNLAE